MRQHEQARLLVRKALEDEALLVEVAASGRISNEIFGFHAQQAAEKLLKAALSEFSILFPRTHNLRLLMDLLADNGHVLPSNLTNLDELTPYGTLFRYEAMTDDVHLDRQTVLTRIRDLRRFVEGHLPDR